MHTREQLLTRQVTDLQNCVNSLQNQGATREQDMAKLEAELRDTRQSLQEALLRKKKFEEMYNDLKLKMGRGPGGISTGAVPGLGLREGPSGGPPGMPAGSASVPVRTAGAGGTPMVLHGMGAGPVPSRHSGGGEYDRDPGQAMGPPVHPGPPTHRDAGLHHRDAAPHAGLGSGAGLKRKFVPAPSALVGFEKGFQTPRVGSSPTHSNRSSSGDSDRGRGRVYAGPVASASGSGGGGAGSHGGGASGGGGGGGPRHGDPGHLAPGTPSAAPYSMTTGGTTPTPRVLAAARSGNAQLYAEVTAAGRPQAGRFVGGGLGAAPSGSGLGGLGGRQGGPSTTAEPRGASAGSHGPGGATRLGGASVPVIPGKFALPLRHAGGGLR